MHNARRYFIIAQLLSRLGNRLNRTLHIAFNNQGHFSALGILQLVHHLVERGRFWAGHCGLFACFARPIISHFTRACLIFDNCQQFARARCATGAQHFNRRRRSGRFHLFAAVINQRTHATGFLPDDKNITDIQRAALHQNRRHRAAPFIELGFNHNALSIAIGFGFQFHQLGLQRHSFQQIIKPVAGLRRDFNHLRVAAHILGNDFLAQKFIFHPRCIGLRLVHFINRHNHRGLSRFGVINRLNGLRHHPVITGNHQNNNIRHFGTARAHGGKGGMARRVNKSD